MRFVLRRNRPLSDFFFPLKKRLKCCAIRKKKKKSECRERRKIEKQCTRKWKADALRKREEEEYKQVVVENV